MATAADVAEVLARATTPQADSAAVEALETDAVGPGLEGPSGNGAPTVPAAAAAAT